MMQNIVVTLVFSMALLMIMVYPALKIVDWVRRRSDYSERTYTLLLFVLTVLLSLVAGYWLLLSAPSGQ